MKSPATKTILWTVLPYVLFASLWILLSDRLLEVLPLDAAARTQWSIYKGWAFVLVTAVLLSVLLHAGLRARKRAEEELRATQANLERRVSERTTELAGANNRAESVLKTGALQNAIFNSANFSSIATDAKGVIQIFNVGAERMLGYAAADVMNKITPADISDPREVIARAKALSAELGTPITPGFEALVFKASRGIEDIYELTYIRKDGSRFPAIVSVTALRDAQGGIIGYLLIGTDNTARKHVEDQLRWTEESFRLMVESVTDYAIVMLDPEGRVLSWNSGAQRIKGYSAEEIVGQHFSRFYPRQDIERGAPQHDLNVAAAKGRFEDEGWRVRKDGSTFWANVIFTAIRDQVGNLRGFAKLTRDLTERRKVEVEITNAKSVAEKANLAKSDFLANMSHELRTPLNSIIGFTGIVLQGLAGPLNPEQTKQLEMVRGSARHLLALINDVLDISKIEAGELKVSCEPFDLRASITKVLGIVKPLAEKKGLALRVQIAPDLGQSVSDPRRVEQILLNLLNNAIKFSERGEVTFIAEVTSEAARMRITDTGIGIKPDDLATLFQPFRQIDSGLSRNHEGTGLGLAICRRLADLLGGEIRAESEWGKGSTFTFTLPLKGRGES
ncbi:MAG: PAS domain S-box protein [Verrucomicrobia bacterium]|nr:PAS domain S-box protein [Verrucomicrobiota bacterium]